MDNNKRWSDKKCNDNALMFNVSYKKDLVYASASYLYSNPCINHYKMLYIIHYT